MSQTKRLEDGKQDAIYRIIYREHHGDGPFTCSHCLILIDGEYVIHHIDENHFNHAIENLTAVHRGCHQKIHMTGKSLPEETRKKISLTRAGKPLTEAQKSQLTNLHANQVSRDKIRQARLGTKSSDETKAKLRAARGKCECGLETNTGNVSRHCIRTGHTRVS